MICKDRKKQSAVRANRSGSSYRIVIRNARSKDFNIKELEEFENYLAHQEENEIKNALFTLSRMVK